MEKEEIIFKLRNIIKPYAQDENAMENISEQTDFINDLKINSANLIDVILDTETQFNIVIDDESMGKMNTVKEAVDIISTKLNQK